jgi:hypothetical protein
MYINEAIKQRKKFKLPNIIKSLKLSSLILFLVVLYLGFMKYENEQAEQKQTLTIISNPKIDDIYFLDFRLLSDKLRPKEKYRIAKVVDITGDIITLLYGTLYYQRQQAAINSIRYGQLSYKDYFELKRYDFPLNTIKTMHSSNAIFLAKRPIRNKLFGNFIGPSKSKDTSTYLTYGKKENEQGEAFLQIKFSETNLKSAFDSFHDSSKLGNVKGQVNLAEMYINGQHVKKDFIQALYWLKQASLQSYKPAILKYDIICKQVPSCNIIDFFNELTVSGVNIKVRKLDFTLDN